MKKKIRFYSILFLAAFMLNLCVLVPARAQYIDNENSFFSYLRFYEQLDILTGVAGSENVRGDIKAFALALADGIQDISAGNREKAKEKLLRARAIWPEYFGTDFLLARVSEDAGDYELSARFYKSYLNKLKAFSEGRYRISAPLMKMLIPYRIEDYDYAYASIRDRLKKRDIDIAAVQPVYTMPGFFKLWLILILLGSGYAIAFYGVIPRIKRWRRINNPPEGSWTCKRCGIYNLNVRIKCEKCGEARE